MLLIPCKPASVEMRLTLRWAQPYPLVSMRVFGPLEPRHPCNRGHRRIKFWQERFSSRYYRRGMLVAVYSTMPIQHGAAVEGEIISQRAGMYMKPRLSFLPVLDCTERDNPRTQLAIDAVVADYINNDHARLANQPDCVYECSYNNDEVTARWRSRASANHAFTTANRRNHAHGHRVA